MRSSIALLAVLFLVCGCVNYQEDPGRETADTAPSTKATTTTSSTTTSSAGDSTTSSSLAADILPNQTCFSEEDNPYTCRENGGDAYCGDGWCKCACPKGKNETLRIDVECDRYCKKVGYVSGSCEANMFECQVRRMVKTHYVDALCIDARKNVCCCGTNRTVEKYSQLLNNAGKGGSGLTFQEK